MDLDLLEQKPRLRGWLAIEWATLAYTAFTTVLIGLMWNTLKNPVDLLIGRAFVVGGLLLTFGLYKAFPGSATRFLRNLFPLTLLAYWYPDTYEFCQCFGNLDPVFAQADAALFGCQPSLEFSRWASSKFWSETFHMGYFAYYPLIFLTVLAPLFTDKQRFEPTAFVVLAGFLCYYLIYLFLPVAGPQYYFHATGTDIIESGVFPEVGDWFRHNTEMRSSPGQEGLFRTLVEGSQASGERPTAAFPSSHVGMSTILLLLLWKNNRWLFFGVLPFYFALCCATVYIEAHYLIDVFGGWVSALVFYKLTTAIYRRWGQPHETAVEKAA